LNSIGDKRNNANQKIVDIFSNDYNRLKIYGLSVHNNKELVEDCIQDLFLKFCENEKLLINSDNPEAYLKVSLRRHIISKVEKKRGETKINSKLIEISVPSYEDALIRSQKSLQDSLNVKKALEHLSPSQKTILTMRFYRSMSYDDIAGKLDIQKRTVYNQIHDAMKKLRKAGLKPS